MKITVVFDSLEEFQKHMTTGREKVEITAQGLTATPAPILEPQEPAAAPEAPKPEKKPKEQEKPAEKPQELEKAPEVPFAEEQKVTVEEVRKILADLNKKAGKNVAKDLIKAVGFKRLTEVTEGALPALKNMAEEEARKYA
jgi:hypothetical protein